jgi:hypothetical protein
MKPALVNSYSAFEFIPINSDGIASTGCVAGDDFVHLYIDKNNELSIITQEGNKKLGYKNQINLLTQPIKISYDKQQKRFYISDGIYCFIYNGTGLYSTHQSVSSIARYKNILCGFTKLGSDTDIRIKTSAFNLNNQGMKTIEAIETDVNYETSIALTTYVNYTYGNEFTQLPDVTLSPLGIATKKATGRDFKLALSGSYSSGKEFSLGNIKVKFKSSDKRNIRGRLNVS